MRITNSMVTNRMLLNINRNARNVDKLYSQLSSGKRVVFPSDNPILAARALKFRTNVYEAEQYQRNVTQGLSWMEITENAFKNVVNITSRIRELLVQGASDENSYSDRLKIAADIEQLVSQLGAEMDVSYAGRYVFSGYRTEQAPVIPKELLAELNSLKETLDVNSLSTETLQPSEVDVMRLGIPASAMSSLTLELDGVPLAYTPKPGITVNTLERADLSALLAADSEEIYLLDDGSLLLGTKISEQLRAGGAITASAVETIPMSGASGTQSTVKLPTNRMSIMRSDVLIDSVSGFSLLDSQGNLLANVDTSFSSLSSTPLFVDSVALNSTDANKVYYLKDEGPNGTFVFGANIAALMEIETCSIVYGEGKIMTGGTTGTLDPFGLDTLEFNLPSNITTPSMVDESGVSLTIDDSLNNIGQIDQAFVDSMGPDDIYYLKDDHIFVFGSNFSGRDLTQFTIGYDEINSQECKDISTIIAKPAVSLETLRLEYQGTVANITLYDNTMVPPTPIGLSGTYSSMADLRENVPGGIDWLNNPNNTDIYYISSTGTLVFGQGVSRSDILVEYDDVVTYTNVLKSSHINRVENIQSIDYPYTVSVVKPVREGFIENLVMDPPIISSIIELDSMDDLTKEIINSLNSGYPGAADPNVDPNTVIIIRDTGELVLGSNIASAVASSSVDIEFDDKVNYFDIEQQFSYKNIEVTHVLQEISKTYSGGGTYNELTPVLDVDIVKLAYFKGVDNLTIDLVNSKGDVVSSPTIVKVPSINDLTGPPSAYPALDNLDVNTVYFIEDTGNLVLGNNVAIQMRTGGLDLKVNYEKAGLDSNDLNPIVYFNCVDKTTNIKYNMDNQNMEYEFGPATRININSLAMNVYTDNMYADLKDFCQTLINTSTNTIESLTAAGMYLSDAEEHLQKESDRLRQMSQARFNSLLGIIDGHISNITREHTDLGSRMSRIELIQNRLEDDRVNYKKLLSDNEDVDYTETAMELNIAESVYQAALQVGARIIQLTLADYIR